MLELKKEFLDMEKAAEGPIEEVARQRQEAVDKIRCEYLGWAQKTNWVSMG